MGRGVSFGEARRQKGEGEGRTHGRDTHERRGDAGVETAAQAVLGDALPNDVHGARVDALLGGLEAHLDQVKGVADDDGAHAAEAAGGKGPQLGETRGRRRLGLGLDLGLELLLALGDVGERRLERLGGRGGGRLWCV